ncbi:MAG: class I SAM-dependent methyltransferase [Bacilli bacterium]|nr:class I SAM-dependent methyltransferase [Bacilli bacterium]
MANRIKAIASLVPPNSVVADIGTDHAYLILELFKNQQIQYAYAIDNKDGPIANAKNNIEKHHLTDGCKVIKANGLDFPLDPKVNTLVLAGLGGMNIISILKHDEKKLKKIKTIITDAHRDNDKVTAYLLTLGYQVKEEKSIIDKKKKYQLIAYHR